MKINIIELEIKPKHFKEATSYITNCPISVVINEKFHTDNLIVGTNYVAFNKKHFTIRTSLNVKDINKCIKNAKHKKKVGTHYIYLIED